MTVPFWQSRRLEEMSDEEWESLCDGCGRCCLVKLEDEESGQVLFTALSCRLLDEETCRCTNYHERKQEVPTCLQLNRDKINTQWLPGTCAYRLIDEGKPLLSWHHLISGDVNAVHRAGVSVRGKVISESKVHPESVEDFIIHWVD